jgi:hypothetical protein
MIEQWHEDVCAHCGFPSADPHIVKNILRAIQLTLDRTGLPPVMKIETVPQSDGDLRVDNFTESQLAEFCQIMAMFKDFKQRVTASTQAPTAIM